MATKTVSIVTGGTNSAPTTAAEINAIATDFIASGVVGAVSLNTGSGGTGSFAPNAQASPNMTVRVSAGQLYVSGTPTGGSSQKVRVSMDVFEDVTISANATGGTRYDWLYVKIDPDKLLNPGANKDDVATLVTSRSTSNTSDNGTPPTYGYNLGYITVANGASSISNSNITDSRVQSGVSKISGVSALTSVASTATVATSETTVSTSYAALTTAGPAVTATIGVNGMALVCLYATIASNTNTSKSYMSFAVSGATTVASSDAFALILNAAKDNNEMTFGASFLVTGLTAGSNTFTAQYKVSANTGTLSNRKITVVPL